MTTGSILFAVGLLLLVGVLILEPIFRPNPPNWQPLSVKEQLLAEKEALVALIRQLDLEYETGILPSAEYQQERAQRLQQAATILRQLEQLPPTETLIENEIARLRKTRACPHCGKTQPINHTFCSECGGNL